MPTKEGDSPVRENLYVFKIISRVSPDTRNLVWIWADHRLRLNITWRPIANKVGRLKNEKYPVEGSEKVPETIYLQAVEALCYLGSSLFKDKLWRVKGVTACLLHNDSASYYM